MTSNGFTLVTSEFKQKIMGREAPTNVSALRDGSVENQHFPPQMQWIIKDILAPERYSRLSFGPITISIIPLMMLQPFMAGSIIF